MQKSQATYQLIWQTRRLFQRLRAVSEELLVGIGVNTSQRAVLEFLYQEKPQTVPQIAQERSVSRQHIQTVVNQLLTLGLIASSENPAHKRSSLIQLTRRGQNRFRSIQEREADFLETLAREFSREELTTTVNTLKALDTYLASGNWKQSTQT
jgi:DNA-binding MarR family transcriptional regulator